MRIVHLSVNDFQAGKDDMDEREDRRKAIEGLLEMRGAALDVALRTNNGDLWRAANDGENDYLLAFFVEQREIWQQRLDDIQTEMTNASNLEEYKSYEIPARKYASDLARLKEMCEIIELNMAGDDGLRGASMADLLHLRRSLGDGDVLSI